MGRAFEMTQQLFRSAHDALVFAYSFEYRSHYPRQPISRLAAPMMSTGSDAGLGGIDGAAQAGMIKAAVKRLGPLKEAALIARFAPRSRPCTCSAQCCSGKQANQAWEIAIDTLSDYARRTQFSAGSSKPAVIRGCVARYFVPQANREHINSLAARVGVNRDTASDCYRAVSRFLGGCGAQEKQAQAGVTNQAYGEIENHLIEAGVVQPELVAA